MSIASTTRKAGPFTGNGITTVFPFTFKVFQASDLSVIKTDLSLAETTLVLTTDYTVSLNANQDSNPGGSITAVVAPASGFLITITSAIPELQPLTLTNAGGFYPTVINDALDRLTIYVQQLSEQVSRAVKTSISSSTTPDTLIDAINTAVSDAAASATAASGSEISAAASAASAAISAAAANGVSYKNKIINGGFSINQRRYASGAAVGANLFGHDRWKAAASGDTYTFSTTNNKTTVTIPAGKTLAQVIEGLNLQTGTYALSWEGTAQGKIGAGSYGATGITGSITGGTDTTIMFNTGTVANVQLELSAIASQFEFRPYPVELALCLRYFETIGGLSGGISSLTSAFILSTAYAHFKFSVEKRVAPTFALVSGTWGGGTPTILIDRQQANFYLSVTDFYLSAASGVIAATFSAEL